MKRLLFLVLMIPSGPSFLGAQELEIVHIDVGQGDATLILGPADDDGQRVSVLIDAGDIPSSGDEDGGLLVAQALAERGIRELGFFVASHYHADHIGGVVTGHISTHGISFLLGYDRSPGSPGDDDSDGDADWLDEQMIRPDPEELGTGDDILVGVFVDRGDASEPSSQTYRKYVAMANAMGRHVSLDSQDEVDSFEIDLGGGARMVALAANGYVRDRSNRVANVNTENERSLCFLVAYDGFHYLIGGDLIGRTFHSENARVETAVGEYLSDNNVNVDILHVNHHGGNNASEFGFLTLIRPEVAVISVGNTNPYDHPHRDALLRLVAAGVSHIYQTGWGATEGPISEAIRLRQAILQGDIVIATDGQSYEVSASRRFGVDEPIM